MTDEPENQETKRVCGKEANWFKPGQSGNPGGRPKGSLSLTSMIRKALYANEAKEASELILAAIKKAKAGDQKLFAILLDRIDGPLAQRTIIETELKGMLATAKSVLEPEQYAILVDALANKT